MDRLIKIDFCLRTALIYTSDIATFLKQGSGHVTIMDIVVLIQNKSVNEITNEEKAMPEYVSLASSQSMLSTVQGHGKAHITPRSRITSSQNNGTCTKVPTANNRMHIHSASLMH